MAMWQRKLKMATDAGHVSGPCSDHGSGQSRSRRFSLWQNGPWEDKEPGAGITSGAWSGAHGPLVEDTRKAVVKGRAALRLFFSNRGPGGFTQNLSIVVPMGSGRSKTPRYF